MTSILFPTDFSLNALSALHYAYELSAYAGGELTLLHVTTDNVTDEEAGMYRLREVSEELHKHFIEKDGVRFSFRLQHGEAAKGICAECESDGYHIVAMGTRGASRAATQAIGSVAAETIKLVQLPVLVIPYFAEFRPIQKIVYAIDYNAFDADKIKSLKAFADVFDAEITLLHVNPSEPFFDESRFENYRKTMLAVTDYEKLRFDFVKGDDVTSALDKYVSENKADLVAMTTRQPQLMEATMHSSVTREMSLYSKVPLLAFHE